MITDLDSDGDGEVSKKELKNVFAKLFPGANFEATWEELDSDGSGSLTTKELANHFGMGHLVTGTKEEEEAAMKQFGGGSMADIEAQLEELSSSELSGTAGGVMTYFFWWDIGIFIVLVRPPPTYPRALAPTHPLALLPPGPIPTPCPRPYERV